MTTQTVTFGAGCFWGVEYVFRRVPGVTGVQVGYAGGITPNPTYREVCSHTTGHAEVLQVQFDDEQVSFDQLLEVFWAMHDPTQVNRQGPDVGPSYRSAIFPQNAQQRAQAARMIAVLRGRGVRVATRLESGGFYPAEAYHQDFERKHPTYPYIVVNDLPKLAALKRKYPQWWKA